MTGKAMGAVRGEGCHIVPSESGALPSNLKTHPQTVTSSSQALPLTGSTVSQSVTTSWGLTVEDMAYSSHTAALQQLHWLLPDP